MIVQKRARNSLRKRAHLGLSNAGEHARETRHTHPHSAVADRCSPARAAGGGADFKNVPVCLIKPPSKSGQLADVDAFLDVHRWNIF